jgi:hypothetical protein
VDSTGGGGAASAIGSTHPGAGAAAWAAIAVPAAATAEHSAARDWALPKTLSVIRGLAGRETAGAALAIELVARLIATTAEAIERAETGIMINPLLRNELLECRFNQQKQ